MVAKRDPRLEDLLPFYLLGGLSDDERSEVEAYLESNPEASVWIESTKLVILALPYAAPPAKAPDRVRRALLERVRQETREGRRRDLSLPDRLRVIFTGTRRTAALAGATLVLLAIAITVITRVVALDKKLAVVASELSALQRELLAQQEVLAVLTSGDLQSFQILGTENQPSARGRLFGESKGGRVVLLASGLSPLEAGEVYQMWLIEGETRTSAGTFAVKPDGMAAVLLETERGIESLDGFGVSIEMGAGSRQPSGPVVMFGALSGGSP